MRKLPHRIIWAFGLGYFVFYAPYSGLTKALTTGLFPGVPAGPSGLDLVPVTTAGTAAAVVAMLTLLGWWRHLAGITPAVVVSGFGTALIVGCTTLAYTFEGVSIVLALLWMRGGVLVIAPLMDLLFARRVRWFSWVALGVAFGTLGIAFASAANGTLTPAAAVNLGLYLIGYVMRLACMTRWAKVEDPDRTRRYFVQELVLALAFLAVAAAALSLRPGFTTFWRRHPAALTPALVIGVLYACLFVFGTLIYLDRRENTFCVALNRGSSILAGVAAAFVLGPAPPPVQLLSAALMIVALLLLSPVHHLVEEAWAGVRRMRARTPAPPPAPDVVAR